MRPSRRTYRDKTGEKELSHVGMKFPLYYPAHFTIFLISCSTGSAEPKYVFCGVFFKVVFFKIFLFYTILLITLQIFDVKTFTESIEM